MRTPLPIAAASFTVTLACFAGCEKQQREHELVTPGSPTPLILDPTESIELSGWWTNDTLLLSLNDNSSYTLWGTQSRYNPPLEHGRWAQDGYAKLWLEPYNRRQAGRIRVPITKTGDAIAIEIPKMAPLRRLTAPPAVVEDRLVGTWTGTIGTLELDVRSRYSFTPAAGQSNRPVVQAGESGAWRIDGTQLILQADAPGSEPLRYSFRADEKQVSINVPGGSLSKR